MTPKQAWKKLGIEPTSDKRAIKRAYAGKLKAIDPDKDPKAFLTLRDALQAANWDASYLDQDGKYEEWEEEAFAQETPEGETDVGAKTAEPASDLITADDINNARSDAPPRHLEAGRWTEILTDINDDAPFDADDEDDESYIDPDFDESAPRNRMSTILWGDDDILLLEDELRTLTREMLESEDMEQIDVAADTEQWLGWIVSSTMRRSDCMIPMLVRHFDWKTKAAAINAPYYMDDILARYRDLVRLTSLRKSSHQDHPLYQRLCRPPSGKLSQAEILMHRGAMRRFVASVRADNPTIEWDFNPETLELWQPHLLALDGVEKKSSWGGWRIGLFALVFLSQVARFCSSGGGGGSDTIPPPVPQPPPALTKSEQSQRDAHFLNQMEALEPENSGCHWIPLKTGRAVRVCNPASSGGPIEVPVPEALPPAPPSLPPVPR